jgi:hypothetical protein
MEIDMIYVTIDHNQTFRSTSALRAARVAHAWRRLGRDPLIEVVIGGGAAPLQFLKVDVSRLVRVTAAAIRNAQEQEL